MLTAAPSVAWVRFEPTLHSHPKLLSLSDGAFRLWTAAISYSVANLTDGALPSIATPRHPLRLSLGLTPSRFKRYVDELYAAKLFEPDARRGVITIHDFLDFQPTRADVERERASNRDRQKRWRTVHNFGDNRPDNASRNGGRDASVTEPVRTILEPPNPPLPLPSRRGGRRSAPPRRSRDVEPCPLCGLTGVHESGCPAAEIGDEK